MLTRLPLGAGVSMTRDDVLAALWELHIASKCQVVGEPSEECAMEVGTAARSRTRASVHA